MRTDHDQQTDRGDREKRARDQTLILDDTTAPTSLRPTTMNLPIMKVP